MAKIIVVAQNYAFGPIGKLLTITPYLTRNGHKLTFIGDGTAYQLGCKENFNKIIRVNTDSPEFEKKMINTFNKADFLLSSMDMASVRLAQRVGLPVIWLDTLFWWRNEIPEYIQKVDCYIKQNTLDDRKNMKLYGTNIKNLYGVNPLVELVVIKTKKLKNQAMVAFGGMEAQKWYRVGKETNYPYIILKLLEKVDFSEFDRVLITGNERIIKKMRLLKTNKKFVFETFSHFHFVQELANSKLVLMAPGLETPLEAFTYGVPVIFLPPSNSSNYMQLDNFIKKNVAIMNIHFSDYYDHIEMENKGFSERLALYLDQLHIFEKDIRVQKDVIKKLNIFIKNKKQQKQQISCQRHYIKGLKSNGLTDCIKIINHFLKTHKKTPRKAVTLSASDSKLDFSQDE